MKKQLFIAACLLIGTFTQAQEHTDWANFGRYAEANASLKSSPTVVFMGNSITDAWPGIAPSFFTDNNYVGRGISGQTSEQMLVRFRSDVINLRPKVAVILAGTNDVAQNNGYIAPEHTMENIISMVELAKANAIRPVLCSILPAYEFGWRPGLEPAGKIVALNRMIRAYAEANDIIYVDYHTVLKDERNGLPESLAKDGVHPTPEGYEIMAKLVQEGINKAL
ncbi:SGNH/GDSL hydrolase family protein [Parabacteroides sp. OttesenSCG-928-N08]|nr:SGNH/GDSL hydrolase family protein [Parabacteroides sp. OttesenSCG-928-N08]